MAVVLPLGRTIHSFPNLWEEADFKIGDSPPFREDHQIDPNLGIQANLKIGGGPPFREKHQIFPSLGEEADLKIGDGPPFREDHSFDDDPTNRMGHPQIDDGPVCQDSPIENLAMALSV